MPGEENNESNRGSSHPQETYFQSIGDLFRIREDLTVLHKAAYIATVFLGLNLAWFGVWTAVESIWPLNVPLVAIVLGVALLYLTGKINDLT